MFGYKSLPSKIYEFGAKEPSNVVLVKEQFFKAHIFRNSLVDLSKKFYSSYLDLRKTYCPLLQAKEEEKLKLNNDLNEIDSKIAEFRKTNKKLKIDEVLKESRVSKKKQLKNLNLEIKKIKDFFSSDDFKLELEVLNKNHNEEKKKLSKTHRDDGLWWGVKGEVLSSVKQKSNFHSWHVRKNHGKITVQIQGGLPVNELFTKGRNDLSAEWIDEKKRYAKIKFKVDGKLEPIEIQVKFHRLLPNDASIKFVYLIMDVIGTSEKWKIQFVVSKKQWEKRPTGNGVCGIDVGWRKLQDGVSVASIKYNDGTYEKLIIPNSKVSRWNKVEDLQSIRDQNFNDILKWVIDWIDDHKNTIPEWMKEKTKTIKQWKSQARLAHIVNIWRDNRIEGDNIIFSEVEAWRKHDRHLFNWLDNQRKNNIKWRDDFYRKYICKLEKKCKYCGIENLRLDVMYKNPSIEEKENKVSTKYRSIASVGRFLELIQQSNMTAIAVNPAYSSMKCNVCKNKCDLPKDQYDYVCEHCNSSWERDYNGATNILEEVLKKIPSESQSNEAA